MAAIMNTTEAEVTVGLAVDHGALRTTPLAAVPWLDAYALSTFDSTDFRGKHPYPKRNFERMRVPIAQRDGAAKVAVQPHNFRLLLLRAAEGGH